ncbi:MAG: metal-dependent hydrolase, partial [Thermoplasmatota archaeon]
LVPPLLALAFLRSLDRRWVMAMAPTTFVADIDYLVPSSWAHAMGLDHVHRVVTHTLVLPAAVLGGLYLAWRSRARTTTPFWDYARRPGWPLAALLLCYYLAAHAVMDVFTGGVVLFWPFLDTNFYFVFQVNLDLTKGPIPEVKPYAEPGTSPGPFGLDEDYPWLTTEHSAMLAAALAVLVVGGLRRAWVRLRGTRSPTAPPPESPEPSTKGK